MIILVNIPVWISIRGELKVGEQEKLHYVINKHAGNTAVPGLD